MGRDLLWNCRTFILRNYKHGSESFWNCKKTGSGSAVDLQKSIFQYNCSPTCADSCIPIIANRSGVILPWATGWADLCSIWGLTAQFFLFFWYSFLGRQCYNMAAILTVEYRDGSSYWTLTPAKDTWTCLTAGLGRSRVDLGSIWGQLGRSLFDLGSI